MVVNLTLGTDCIMVTAITDRSSRSLVFPWRGLTLILWSLKEAYQRVSVYIIKVICTCVIIWFFEPLWGLSWASVNCDFATNARHLTRSYSLNDFWKLKRLQQFIHLTTLANLIHLGSRTQVCTRVHWQPTKLATISAQPHWMQHEVGSWCAAVTQFSCLLFTAVMTDLGREGYPLWKKKHTHTHTHKTCCVENNACQPSVYIPCTVNAT